MEKEIKLKTIQRKVKIRNITKVELIIPIITKLFKKP